MAQTTKRNQTLIASSVFDPGYGVSVKSLEDYMLHGYPKEMFVESEYKGKHKHPGWHYDNVTKKFYRYNDLIALYKDRK